jgi:hypothetical protein
MLASMKRSIALLTLLIAPILCQANLLWQFDFGSETNPSPATSWNNVYSSLGYQTNSDTLSNLITTDGLTSGASLQVLSWMNGPNWLGTTESTVFPDTATADNLFGHTQPAGGEPSSTPRYKLAGLDPKMTYNFKFYGSRVGVSDNRETRYIVTGEDITFTDLNTSNNIDNFVELRGMTPNDSGEFMLEITQGPNNDNSSGFIYLGVMTIEAVSPTMAVPISAGALWLLVGGILGLGVAAAGQSRKGYRQIEFRK